MSPKKRALCRLFWMPLGVQDKITQLSPRFGGFASIGSSSVDHRLGNMQRATGRSMRTIGYRKWRVSSTTTETVDCPDLTFSDTRRNVAGGKIPLTSSVAWSAQLASLVS